MEIYRTLRSLAKKLFGLALSKPLPPPSNEETIFLSELQADFQALPIVETSNVLPSEAAWLSNVSRLKELVLCQDPRAFLRWDVVSHTMFITFAHYIATELRFLKKRPDWNTRWREAIKESLVGHPIRYVFYPASSANLIHHAYHVAQFEAVTKCNISNLNYVFEFGGGYGSMCRLFHNLGFKGKYIIFDLPPFSALQQYFLKTLGLPVRLTNDHSRLEAGIKCISDFDRLKGLLSDNADTKKSLFLATWSISETPVAIRDTVLPLVANFQSFLIAYQDRFEEVNNVEFFDNWKNRVTTVTWKNWAMEHTPGNSYLVGSVADVMHNGSMS